MRLSIVLIASLFGSALAASAAENWPGTKPLKFEGGSAPGGIIDIVPREMSNYLSAALGVPVVVESRPGAGGNIAAAFVAKSEPDGHTLLVTGSNQAVNPTLLPNPGFDYHRDLAPVSMAVIAKMLLVAAPAFPAKTITDVVNIAKQKPKSVSIAIAPIGTANHLGAEMLAQYGDIDLTVVPYDAAPQALPDLMTNRVDLEVANISWALPQIRNGTLKALAVLSPERSPLAPAIPTAAEAGMPNLLIDAWICIMTTGGTPTPIITRLDAEIAKVLALPEVRNAFAKQGIEVLHMGPDELGKFLDSEAARFSNLLKHSRVKATSQ